MYELVELDFRQRDDSMVPGDYYHFDNPLKYGARSTLIKAMYEFKTDLIKTIVRYYASKLFSLTIDEDDVINHFKLKNDYAHPKFDAFSVADYIITKYNDVEGMSFQQILKCAKDALPFGYYGADGPTHHCRLGQRYQFNTIKDTGVVLKCYGEYSNSKMHRVACVIKLISIVVGGLPAASDLKVPVTLDHGKAYSNMFIKSLMMYKNGNLKIIFNAPGDLEKFLQALLSEAK